MLNLYKTCTWGDNIFNEKTFRDRGSGFVVRLINIDDFTTDQSAKKIFKKNNYFFYCRVI